MIPPHIGVAGAADLIDSESAPPVLVFLSREVTAVRCALERRAGRRPLSWLALTKEDDDPVRFIDRMAASFEPPLFVVDRRGDQLAPSAVSSPAVSGVRRLPAEAAEERAFAALTDLLNRLYAEHLDRSLVLDGFEAVSDASVQRLVAHLLEFLPATLRVVIFTTEARALPGIPRLLVRERARLYVCEARCGPA